MSLTSLLLALIVAAFALLTITAALKDLVSYTIPNWISLSLLALFPLAALAAGLSWAQIGMAVALGAAALVAGIAMFALNWIGGGDAKLLAACMVWVGLPGAPTFLLTTAVAGGALAVGLLTLRSAAFRPIALLGPRWLDNLADPKAGAPYGVAIAVGALAAFARSPIAASLS